MIEVQTFFKTARIRCKAHTDWVGTLPCVLGCFDPAVPHHLTISPEPKARGLKAGDNWTVPLCHAHHSALHARGDERAFWTVFGVDPLTICLLLWQDSQKAGRAKVA